jgi:hypothetical protein
LPALVQIFDVRFHPAMAEVAFLVALDHGH